MKNELKKAEAEIVAMIKKCEALIKPLDNEGCGMASKALDEAASYLDDALAFVREAMEES